MSTTFDTVARSRLRGLLVPALVAAVMLALLIALGMWQLQRRVWKLGILAQIDAAEVAPPAPLGDHPLPFTKVSVAGTLRTDVHALYGVDVRADKQGAQLIEPLERPGQDTILVDRGWVPEGQEGVAAQPGPVAGYVRLPDKPGTFSPDDDLAARHFYTLDPVKIGAALGLAHVAPFTLVQLGSGDGLPETATALPRPPNDHLNYALTWFGLAFSLVVVFGFAARKVLRE